MMSSRDVLIEAAVDPHDVEQQRFVEEASRLNLDEVLATLISRWVEADASELRYQVACGVEAPDLDPGAAHLSHSDTQRLAREFARLRAEVIRDLVTQRRMGEGR